MRNNYIESFFIYSMRKLKRVGLCIYISRSFKYEITHLEGCRHGLSGHRVYKIESLYRGSLMQQVQKMADAVGML